MDIPLTPKQIQDFRCLAGYIIPPVAGNGIPGADDEKIFQDILRNVGRDAKDISTALESLADLCEANFSDLDPDSRIALIPAFRAIGGPPLDVLVRLVLLCYYRDDRVMVSLGLEPRPPFPKGHPLSQGDWSLLDPVRMRQPFYRKS